MARKIEYNKSKGQVIKCHCTSCNNDTNHEVLMNVKIDDDEEIEKRFSISWFDDYQIVSCRGCDNVSFKQISYFSEYWEPEHGGKSYYYYPERKIKRALEIQNLPNKLSSMYNEVIDAYNVGALTLVSSGLRAIIEGICSTKGIDKGFVPSEKNGIITKNLNKTLQGKIYGLQEAGYISEKQIDVLHELRFLGNSSLHEIEKPQKEQIDIAFRIIESILELVFGVEENSKKLRSYREKNNNIEKHY